MHVPIVGRAKTRHRTYRRRQASATFDLVDGRVLSNGIVLVTNAPSHLLARIIATASGMQCLRRSHLREASSRLRRRFRLPDSGFEGT
jgi:hypothetical protein